MYCESCQEIIGSGLYRYLKLVKERWFPTGVENTGGGGGSSKLDRGGGLSQYMGGV